MCNLVPIIDPTLNQEHWEYSLKLMMNHAGWNLDKDDDKILRFSYVENSDKWLREYDKGTKELTGAGIIRCTKKTSTM